MTTECNPIYLCWCSVFGTNSVNEFNFKYSVIDGERRLLKNYLDDNHEEAGGDLPDTGHDAERED